MAGKALAVAAGAELVQAVSRLGQSLGLQPREQVRVGKRIWGAVRCIDIVLTNPVDRRRLGIECKFQGTAGTAEEKIPTTLQDIAVWPIRGIVVFAGDGFSDHMRSFLLASGTAVAFEDLEPWLRLFFGLEL